MHASMVHPARQETLLARAALQDSQLLGLLQGHDVIEFLVLRDGPGHLYADLVAEFAGLILVMGHELARVALPLVVLAVQPRPRHSHQDGLLHGSGHDHAVELRVQPLRQMVLR